MIIEYLLLRKRKLINQDLKQKESNTFHTSFVEVNL